MRLTSRMRPSHKREKSVEPVTATQNSATAFHVSAAGCEEFSHGSEAASVTKSADAKTRRCEEFNCPEWPHTFPLWRNAELSPSLVSFATLKVMYFLRSACTCFQILSRAMVSSSEEAVTFKDWIRLGAGKEVEMETDFVLVSKDCTTMQRHLIISAGAAGAAFLPSFLPLRSVCAASDTAWGIFTFSWLRARQSSMCLPFMRSSKNSNIAPVALLNSALSVSKAESSGCSPPAGAASSSSSWATKSAHSEQFSRNSAKQVSGLKSLSRADLHLFASLSGSFSTKGAKKSKTYRAAGQWANPGHHTFSSWPLVTFPRPFNVVILRKY